MRYAIRSMFAILSLAAVGCLAMRYYYLDRQPLQLKPYSKESRDEALRNGQCILVTIYGNWDLHTADPLRWLSHDVTRRIRSRNMLAMDADWTNHASHVTALMKEHNVTTVPALVMYAPADPDKPTVIRNFPDENHVLSVIDACCR